MCAGAIYYAGIPRVVFALSQEGLRSIAGAEDGPEARAQRATSRGAGAVSARRASGTNFGRGGFAAACWRRRDTIWEIPSPPMVTPYSTSAASMVRFWWVTTMNCARSAYSRSSATNRPMLGCRAQHRPRRAGRTDTDGRGRARTEMRSRRALSRRSRATDSLVRASPPAAARPRRPARRRPLHSRSAGAGPRLRGTGSRRTSAKFCCTAENVPRSAARRSGELRAKLLELGQAPLQDPHAAWPARRGARAPARTPPSRTD